MQQSFSTKLFRFADLSPFDLYEIMILRQTVFIVEQNCPYLDADGLDYRAWHLLVYDLNKQLVAYTRLLPIDVPYAGYASIGRVVNLPKLRGTGLGRFLMQQSIATCNTLFGNVPIKIGAQSYLIRFYESFGFCSTGENYLEDGIPHTKMILDLR
jgi:ElaA protein